MIRPGKADFPLYNWAGPGQNSCTLRIAGYDFSSGAGFLAQFRDYRDAQGSARIALSNAATTAEGVSCTIANENGVIVSYVVCRVNETTVEAVAAAISPTPPANGVYPMVWDLQITSSGLGKVRWVEGDAPIYAGVSR